MTLVISPWIIPTVVTIVLWTLLLLWPMRSSGGGDYGFGAAFEALFRFGAGVIATLLCWLVFLAAMLWIAT